MRKRIALAAILVGSAFAAEAAQLSGHRNPRDPEVAGCILAIDQSNYGMFCRKSAGPQIDAAIARAQRSGRRIIKVHAELVDYVNPPGSGQIEPRYFIEVFTEKK
jgi:hypothetical protein